MIKPLLLLSLFLCLCSCNNKHTKQVNNAFIEFVFSQSGEDENYSIKLTKSDTIFLEERFPKPVKQYYAILTDTVRKKLDFMFDTLNLGRFDTSYIEEGLKDGVFYKFYLHNDTLVKTISIYGYKAPEAIYPFARWLDNFAKTVTKYPTNKKVDFGDLTGVNPPSVPPPIKTSN